MHTNNNTNLPMRNVLLMVGTIVLMFAFLHVGECAKKQKEFVEKVYDVKDFKKLLRTRKNVLVVFMKTARAGTKTYDEFNNAAKEMKGKATICSVDCGEASKLCKKMKISPSPLLVQHYQDSEFNKVYDRPLVTKSIVSFLEDPTGDIPWEEEASAKDVIHVATLEGLEKLMFKSKKPVLAMFYAPWCGHCKRLKPEFAAAATETKATVILAGVNADKPALAPARQHLNITGYPTLYYFSGGQLQYKYGGEYNKASILSWLANPSAPKEPEKEESWSEKETDVHHLTDNTFDEFLAANPSVLVMFYAPWCGHCKAMKPDYEEVATTLKADELEAKLAAVDATENRKLAGRFSVEGFPTVIYFQNGEKLWKINERTKEKLLAFMKNPEEPPAPPAPEVSWSEVESEVVHLTAETFQPTLKKRKHALVMFYAPWCGHCKKAKPHFTEAASKFAGDSKKTMAAIDCTEHASVCSKYSVSGYPTFMYFNYGKNEKPYSGGREEVDFVSFMEDPENPQMRSPKPAVTDMWAGVEGVENVAKLTEANFTEVISSNPSVLVMFYAPWCGHCKNMKPDYAAAASELKAEGITGILAAVDSTVESSISTQYGVKGFPTLKYFKDGKFLFDYNQRSQAALVKLMKHSTLQTKPKKDWASIRNSSNVHHLTKDSFSDFITENPSVLVMFYSPGCVHCESMKPAYAEVATMTKTEELEGKLATIDCSQDDICDELKVTMLPTLKYFHNGIDVMEYTGGRDTASLIDFIRSPLDYLEYMTGSSKLPEAAEPKKRKEEL